jgi:hypothetical protein
VELKFPGQSCTPCHYELLIAAKELKDISIPLAAIEFILTGIYAPQFLTAG